MRTAEPLAAARRAGAACGCAALVYLAARTALSALADGLLALRVPGASLDNPVGTGLLASTLLTTAVAALALLSPFVLLRLLPRPAQNRPQGLSVRLLARAFLLFWAAMLAGNLLASLLPGGEHAGGMELPPSGAVLAAAWLATCLVPAVGEELLFRGLMQGWLAPCGPAAAIFGPAVLFALLHGRPAVCAAALLAGVALGICAWCSGSLVPGMVFHLYNNTLAFAGQYSQQYGTLGVLYYLLLFAAPAAALVIGLRRGESTLRGRLGSWRGAGLRALAGPGYLAAAALLLARCVYSTVMN